MDPKVLTNQTASKQVELNMSVTPLPDTENIKTYQDIKKGQSCLSYHMFLLVFSLNNFTKVYIGSY